MTKTYTTQEARAALGLNSASAILRIIKVLGITPERVPALNAHGFNYSFTQAQVDLMRDRPKRGRPKHTHHG